MRRLGSTSNTPRPLHAGIEAELGRIPEIFNVRAFAFVETDAAQVIVAVLLAQHSPQNCLIVN
jgi:hypothetical protein